MVAISVAVNSFFWHCDHWQEYWTTAKCLKIEGWKVFQFSLPYQSSTNPTDTYTDLAKSLKIIIKKDVELSIDEVIQEKPQEEKEEKGKKEEKDVTRVVKLNSLELRLVTKS
jgi:hypothetical protein